MLVLNERVFAMIKINGAEITTGPSSIYTIAAVEGNGMVAPALQIVIRDALSNYTGVNAIADGSPVELIVAKSVNDVKVSPRKYRLFGQKTVNTSQGPILILTCILAAPKYTTASTQEAYAGTSDVVMKKICDLCGLTFSGPADFNGRSMSDSQVWLNVSQSRAAFALEITKHSYMDAHSGMGHCLTSYGVLKLRNLVDVISTKLVNIKYVFLHNAAASDNESDKKTYLVKEALDRSISGTMTAWMNYGTTRIVQNLDGTTTKHEDLEVKTNGKYLPINAKVKEQVGRSRHDYAPIDCGNTHQNYERAYYQNIKIAALFSERLSILVYDVTEVSLFDPIIYRQADIDPATPVKNTDVYIVIGKTIFVSGGTYYAERIEIAKMSLTMEGSSELTKPNSVDSEKSLIPDLTLDSSGTKAADTYSISQAISTAKTKVTDSTSGLQGIKSTITGALSPLHDGINSVNKAIVGGTQSAIDATLGDLLPSMKSTLGSANSVAGLQSTCVSSVASLIALTKSYPANLKQALSGNILKSTVAQFTSLSALKQSYNTLKNLKKTIPTNMSLSNLNSFNSTLSNLGTTLAGCETNVTNQWNSSVDYLNGRVTNPLSISQNAGLDFGRQINTMANSYDTTDAQLEKTFSKALSSSSSAPQYVSSGSLFTSVDPVESVSSSNAILQNHITRLTEA